MGETWPQSDARVFRSVFSEFLYVAMLKRVTLELRGRPPNKLHELDLDGVKCMGEIDFGDLQFDNLEAVTLSRANLTSLKNFPTFPSLVKLDLCHNRLSKGLENLKDCTKLKCLLLSGNRFKASKELEFLLPLVSLSSLTHLELGEKFFNDDDEELSSAKMRPKAFSLLPQLQYLDGVDRHGNAEDEDDQPVINGTLSDDDDDEDDDDNSDGDDELDEEEVEEEEDVGDSDDDGESEDDDRLAYNEEANGTNENYHSSSSESGDEEDTETAPVVRGKKRKFESEDLLQ